MLSGKHINETVAILTCLFIWQANAYINFVYKIDDNSLNTITSNPIVSKPADTNRFTSSLMTLFGLNGMPSNTRGPTHDTPPIPCRCRKYSI